MILLSNSATEENVLPNVDMEFTVLISLLLRIQKLYLFFFFKVRAWRRALGLALSALHQVLPILFPREMIGLELVM